MKELWTVLAGCLLLAACAPTETSTQEAAAPAAEEEPAPPSRGMAEVALGETGVTIDYGRPELKGRDMISQLPDGEVWRLGMNEATALETSGNLTFGDTLVEAGRYALFARKVNADEWRLIFNSEPDVWGTERNPDSDLFDVPLEKTDLTESVEQFTIQIEATGADSAEIIMEWGTLRLRATFQTASLPG